MVLCFASTGASTGCCRIDGFFCGVNFGYEVKKKSNQINNFLVKVLKLPCPLKTAFLSDKLRKIDRSNPNQNLS